MTRSRTTFATACLTFAALAVSSPVARAAGPAAEPAKKADAKKADATKADAKKTKKAEQTKEGEPADAATAAAPGEIQVIEKSALGVTLKVHHFSLDNGLRVYVVEDHSVPAFSMHTSFRVGSRDEAEGKTGFAHFFEHMMFKGSENVPDGGYFEYVLGAGGEMNAFTMADITQYYAVLPSNYLDLALWLESDRLRSLAVTQENFDNQRAAVMEERAMRIENQPYAEALTQFFADVWTGTGYGHMAIGSKEDLEAATVDDVKAFFDQHYVPNNASIAVVGDVDVAEVKAKIEKYYGDIPAGTEPAQRPEIDHTQKKLERTAEDPKAQQPLYVLGWKTVPEAHPDRHALELLMGILLSGESARITQILKDEKKLVLASMPLPSMAAGGRDAGVSMAAFVPVAGADFEAIKKVVLEEIEQVKTKGISQKDLKKAINQKTVETMGSLAENNFRALMIARSAALEGDPTHFLTDLEKYQKVTTKDIKRVANEYLTDEWLLLQIVPKK